ncbi:MAG: hypothetical protein ACP5I8_14450 [Phycisphaerae bacterium]
MIDSQPIPPDLLDRLESLRESLSHNGSTCRRLDRGYGQYWRLRVRVKDPDTHTVRQLSIPIREGYLLTVDALLLQWRDARIKEKAGETHERQAQMADILRYVHGGRRKKRYARKVYRKAMKQGALATWIAEIGETYQPPVKPNGRPRKRSLKGLAHYLIPADMGAQNL